MLELLPEKTLEPRHAAAAAPVAKSKAISPPMAASLLVGWDLLWLALGLGGVALAMAHMPSPVSFYVYILATTLCIHGLHAARLYEVGRARDTKVAILRVAGAWSIGFAISAAPAALMHGADRPLAIELVWVATFGLLALTVGRGLAGLWLDQLIGSGYWHSRIAVLGAGEHGRRLLAHLKERHVPVEIVGLFDDRYDRLPHAIQGIPVMGGSDDLLAFAKRHPIDEIILALPSGAERRLGEWFEKLAILPIKLTLCKDVPAHLLDRPITDLFGLPAAQLSRKPLDGWGSIVKAIEDRVLAAIALILFSPLLGIIALAIKLSGKGPILFRQKRFGFNNDEIEVLKFRSMHVHQGPVAQAKRDDPRITPVGRFLRQTSLDELPQLLNVIKGEMSLVGPRPHAVAHNELYAESINRYLRRHRVKPGITGWAQVNGWRGETDTLEKMEARVDHDLHYIENWSLWFDFKILLLTIIVGFRHPNAY